MYLNNGKDILNVSSSCSVDPIISYKLITLQELLHRTRFYSKNLALETLGKIVICIVSLVMPHLETNILPPPNRETYLIII